MIRICQIGMRKSVGNLRGITSRGSLTTSKAQTVLTFRLSNKTLWKATACYLAAVTFVSRKSTRIQQTDYATLWFNMQLRLTNHAGSTCSTQASRTSLETSNLGQMENCGKTSFLITSMQGSFATKTINGTSKTWARLTEFGFNSIRSPFPTESVSNWEDNALLFASNPNGLSNLNFRMNRFGDSHGC